jgi:hypothetical protein
LGGDSDNSSAGEWTGGMAQSINTREAADPIGAVPIAVVFTLPTALVTLIRVG